MADLIGGKVLHLRWAASCADCGRALAPGDKAWWFHLEDMGRCLPCAEPPEPTPAAPAEVDAEEPRPLLHAPEVDGPAPPPPPPPRPSPPAETPAPPAREARAPGASAQAEYERRRRQDRERIRRRLPRLLAFVLAAPLVGYFAVQLGADLLEPQLRAFAPSAAEADISTEPTFDDALVHLLGLCVAFTLTISALRTAFGARQSTEAWRIGAAGERLTGKALQKLPLPYRVLHDLSMGRSKANIDHVVVGPTGVFTIETKNYRKGVKIKNGRVFGAGRNLDGVVRQARRQAAAIGVATGADVTPIVCVHGGGVTIEGWFQKPVVDGVRFCTGRRLTKTITSYPVELNDEAIEQIERRLA